MSRPATLARPRLAYLPIMLDAILFELEGVLAETAAARRESAIAALARDGVATLPTEYDAVVHGLPVRGALEALLASRGQTRDDTMLDLLARDAEREFAERIARGVTLARGASAFVQGAAGRARLGIVTRASRREAETLLSMSGLADAFECVLCGEDAYPPKPAMAPYLGALERLSRRRPVHPRRVLAVEDGLAGIRSARAALVRCAAVGSLPAHEAMEADVLIESLAEHSVTSLVALVATDGAPRR